MVTADGNATQQAQPEQTQPEQTLFVSMPKTREAAVTSSALLTGNIVEAERYIPIARQQMSSMHMINVNDLEIYSRFLDMGGGNFINCQRVFTNDVAHIHVDASNKTVQESEIEPS